MKRKIGFGFLILIGAIVALYFGVSLKVYPVATVNDALISARSFELASGAAKQYYSRLIEVSGGLASTTPEQFESEMRVVALQALIEDQLVLTELQKRYDANSLEAATQARVDAVFASSSEKTVEAIRELLNLDVAEFKEVVLAPQARVELLTKELETDNIDFAVWISDALQSANVSIVVSDLAWRSGHVELSGEQTYTAKVKEVFEQLASTTAALQQAETASSTASSTKE